MIDYMDHMPSAKPRKTLSVVNKTDRIIRNHPARFQTKKTIESHLVHQKERVFRMPDSVKQDLELIKSDKETSRSINKSISSQKRGILRLLPFQRSERKSVKFIN